MNISKIACQITLRKRQFNGKHLLPLLSDFWNCMFLRSNRLDLKLMLKLSKKWIWKSASFISRFKIIPLPLLAAKTAIFPLNQFELQPLLCLTRFFQMIGATAEDECLMCPTNSIPWAGSSDATAICCDSMIDIISVVIGLCLTLSLYLSTNKQRKSRVYLLLSKIIIRYFAQSQNWITGLSGWWVPGPKEPFRTRSQPSFEARALLVGQTVWMYPFLSILFILGAQVPTIKSPYFLLSDWSRNSFWVRPRMEKSHSDRPRTTDIR